MIQLPVFQNVIGIKLAIRTNIRNKKARMNYGLCQSG